MSWLFLRLAKVSQGPKSWQTFCKALGKKKTLLSPLETLLRAFQQLSWKNYLCIKTVTSRSYKILQSPLSLLNSDDELAKQAPAAWG